MTEKVLFIDSTVKETSRTRALSEYLISKLNGEITTLKLEKEDIPFLNKERLNWRSDAAAKKNFQDDYFNYAKQFASADIIVIAAPFWDNSFPAILKKYIETISVCNLTFEYTKEGQAVGLCKAKKLFYITTAGGYVTDRFGYEYIESLAKTMFGISETILFKAEGLDIFGNDIDGIMSEAYKKIDAYFG